MIFNLCRPGQMCNQLFLFANLLAYGRENNIHIVNLAFYEYKNIFPIFRLQQIPAHPPIHAPVAWIWPFRDHKWSYRLAAIIRMLPILRNRLIERDHSAAMDAISIFKLRERSYFMNTWSFRVKELLEKHGDEIRSYFTPDEAVLTLGALKVEKVRKKEGCVIGVHIRKGDYKNFEQGEHFYSYDEYADACRSILQCSKTPLSFVICSNEPLDPDSFSEFDFVFAGGNAIEDLHTLASCDYIIGPPSTFSMWASFWGQKPLRFIRRTRKQYALEEFKMYPDQD